MFAALEMFGGSRVGGRSQKRYPGGAGSELVERAGPDGVWRVPEARYIHTKVGRYNTYAYVRMYGTCTYAT